MKMFHHSLYSKYNSRIPYLNKTQFEALNHFSRVATFTALQWLLNQFDQPKFNKINYFWVEGMTITTTTTTIYYTQLLVVWNQTFYIVRCDFIVTLFSSGRHDHTYIHTYNTVSYKLRNRFGHLNLCQNLQSVSLS